MNFEIISYDAVAYCYLFFYSSLSLGMDEWSGRKSSTRTLHEAINQSINGLVDSNPQGKEINDNTFFRNILF